jgi:hypothetical protein
VLALKVHDSVKVGVDEVEDFLLISKLLAFEKMKKDGAHGQLGQKNF